MPLTSLHHPLRTGLAAWLLAGAVAGAPAATAAPWPAELEPVQQALAQAKLPPESLGIWIHAIRPTGAQFEWQARQAMNPASLAKLATTWAALEQLGPAWTWHTPVWLNGRLQPDSGVLEGDLVIKGTGDPKLVLERLWLLLRQVQALGVREIRGHIVLDRSAFAPYAGSPADFDGEPWRPGNVQPDALLLNYKALTYSFRPDPERHVAWVSTDVPPLDGGAALSQLPLSGGACEDWRGALKAQWIDSKRPRFGGSYPAACGELRWPVADPDPRTFNARLLAAMWRELGGKLGGEVLEGKAPATPPSFEFGSPPLAEVVRDINKFSANLMAEQLLLSLARPVDGAPVTLELARQQLRDWLAQRLGDGDFLLSNGSGLSRDSRLSAAQLGGLLLQIWASPSMPEMLASLPLAGQDGTLARGDAKRFGAAQGRAHLKTGSLRDVSALAGYMLSVSGQRYAFVAIVNHGRALAARPALDALLRWTAQDMPGAARAAP